MGRLAHRPKGFPVVYTVLTVPKPLRDALKDPKAWGKIRRKAWAMLKNEFGALYGVEASHPHGENPGRDGFHPHLNFLWIPSERRKGYLNVDRLRFLWARVLGYDAKRPVVVHTEYAHGKRKIQHWARYVVRPWPGYSWWTGAVRWYGDRKFVNAPREHDPWTCETCKTEYVFDAGTSKNWARLMAEWRLTGGDPAAFLSKKFPHSRIRYVDRRGADDDDPQGSET